MNHIVTTYSVYLTISIAITIWVAKTIHKNGRVFLVDSFLGNEPLADSVNRLLVVGFYLVNIGFITLFLRSGLKPHNLQSIFEALSSKIGIVLMVLGFMHFLNIYIFSKMRKRALIRNAPPPVVPNSYITPATTETGTEPSSPIVH